MKKKISHFISLSRRMNLGTRLVALVLTLVLVFYAIPTVVFAEVGEAVSSALGSGSSNNSVGDAVLPADGSISFGGSYLYNTDLYEIVELREESTKHFHLPDGTYIAAQYPYPVHFTDDDGSFADIDNVLTEDGDGFGNKSARIKFAKKTTGNETLFTLKENNTKITMSLLGAKKGVVGSVTNGTDNEEDTELGKQLNLEWLTASVLYEDILNDIDLEYVVQGLNVKENIIVKERSESYAYAFELKLTNLTAELSESGDISILGVDGNVKYLIPAPLVYDSAGAVAPRDKAYYSLVQNGNKYTLTVTADAAWMNEDDRAFPITVDPSLTAYGASNIIDTYINEINHETSFSFLNTAVVSKTSTAYIKATALPNIPDTAYISNVSLIVKAKSIAGSGNVGAYEVTSDWNNMLTWDKRNSISAGTLGTLVQDYSFISSGVSYTFDITALGRKWYSGANYGVALKYLGTSSAFNLTLFTTENLIKKPAITVSYVDMGGFESYMPLMSHSAGSAGTGRVNLATGQLGLTVPLLGTTDFLMPITVGLEYNSALSGKEYVYGNVNTAYTTSYTPMGFKLNIAQTVISKKYLDSSGTEREYYLYIDADGTEHAFYVSGTDSTVYYDEDGLQMKLSFNQDGNLIITDPSQQVLVFSAMSATPAAEVLGAWYLSEINDVFGNAVIIGFENGTSYKPVSVSLKPKDISAIEILKLHYNSSGKLDAVYNLTSREAAVLRYSDYYNGVISSTASKYLKKIEFSYGTASVTESDWNSFFESSNNGTNISVNNSAYYDYSSVGRITKATDIVPAKSIKYEWAANKIAYLQEYGGSSGGQRIGITFFDNYSEVQSTGNDDVYGTEDDIKTKYVLDDRGRAVSTYSYSSDRTEIYGAVTGEYEQQENAKNNLANETVLDNNSPNYLINGDFCDRTDAGALKYWTVSGNSAVTYGNDSITVTPVANGSFTLTQYVRLDVGDYTLSFVADSRYSDGLTGSVSVTSQESSSINVCEVIPFKTNLFGGGYSSSSVVSVSFTVTETMERIKVEVRITAAQVNQQTKLALSKFMLAEGIGVSDFNLVEMSDFCVSAVTSGGTTAAQLSDYWHSKTGSTVNVANDADSLFGNCLSLAAQQYGVNYVKQRIFELSESEINDMIQSQTASTNANKVYTVSGFGKAAEAMPSDTGIFAIRVDVYYYQSSTTDDIVKSYYFNFMPSCREWQFAGGSFNAKYDDIYYDENGNYVNEEGSFNWVRAIDVVCEYSYQAQGTAYFDRISVCETTADRIDYTYYYDGMLRAAESYFYSEYYEYNDDKQCTRVANNRGELTDYTYESGILTAVTDYTFTDGSGSGYYPAFLPNPDSQIVKTPVKRQTYTYNSYGLLTDEVTVQVTLDSDGEIIPVPGGEQIKRHCDYDVSGTSKIFGALLREKNNTTESVRYFYDTSNGKLLASVDEYGTSGVSYTYNYYTGKLSSVQPASYSASSDSYSAESEAERVLYGYNSNGQLISLQTESTVYRFTYNVFGNTASVKADDSTLAQYTYNDYNGKLCKITYGNGFSEEYSYNEIELLSEIWYTYSDGTKVLAFSYEYTKDGELYKFTDHIDGRYTVYRYTGTGKLISMSQYSVDDTKYGLARYCMYNDRDYLFMSGYCLSYFEGTASKTANIYDSFQYNSDGSVSEKNISANGLDIYIDYTYDVYKRVSGTEMNVGSDVSPSLSIDYGYTYRTYTDGDYIYTDGRVSTFTSTVNGVTRTYTYEYDSQGNITRITDSAGLTYEYTYDNLNQLLSESRSDGLEFVFTYDDAGNVTFKGEYVFDEYGCAIHDIGDITYNDFGWRDIMQSVSGIESTYDEMGNPLYYYNVYYTMWTELAYNFTWNGRQLATATHNGKSMSYTYNSDGIRTGKTVDGVTTTYHLNGSQIIGEETDTYVIVYLYDAAGSPIGMQYREFSYDSGVWDTYFYEKNLFGDIVSVYDEQGTKLITYEYDPWGKIYTTRTFNNAHLTGAVKNPFCYRGYYYDSETGFYYLNSRYYDPVLGRFISPDSFVSTGQGLIGDNMFAYCNNNPVRFTDEYGESPMPFWSLPFMGYIHYAIQKYLSSCGYEIEHVLKKAPPFFIKGGRVDLVKSSEAYEIKPFTVSKEKAMEQLNYYIELSGHTLFVGSDKPELTGTLPEEYAPNFIVKFYYVGDGIIQYSFQLRPIKAAVSYPVLSPSKQNDKTTQKTFIGVATVGLAAAIFVGGAGGSNLINNLGIRGTCMP